METKLKFKDWVPILVGKINTFSKFPEFNEQIKFIIEYSKQTREQPNSYPAFRGFRSDNKLLTPIYEDTTKRSLKGLGFPRKKIEGKFIKGRYDWTFNFIASRIIDSYILYVQEPIIRPNKIVFKLCDDRNELAIAYDFISIKHKNLFNEIL